MTKADLRDDGEIKRISRGSIWPIIAIIVAFAAFVAIFWYLDFDPTRERLSGYGSSMPQSDIDLDALDDFLGGLGEPTPQQP